MTAPAFAGDKESSPPRLLPGSLRGRKLPSMTRTADSAGRDEPEFMVRIRRLFVEGLPDRVERMRRGLDGIAADVAAGRGPTPDHLEDLFLAAHSLKGTAPGIGAEDLGWEAGKLSDLAREWSTDAPPPDEALARARDLLQRVERACADVRGRMDGDAVRSLAEGD